MSAEQAQQIIQAAYEVEVTYRHRTYIEDSGTKQNIKKLAEYITSDNSKFGIMFCGVCGNGKTTLLLALQNATNCLSRQGYLNDCKSPSGQLPGIQIVDAKEVQVYAKDYSRFKSLKSVPILAIEDMGREAAEVVDYGNVLNPVIDLLEHRYNNQMTTFITTNLTGAEIRDKYGNRIADRFNEMMEVIIFRNNSYRERR